MRADGGRSPRVGEVQTGLRRAVADARRVHQQVAHRHRSHGVDEADLAVGVALPDLDPRNSGRYRSTGSFSATCPCSYRVSSATPVTGLVIEKMRQIVSSADGGLRSRSASPMVRGVRQRPPAGHQHLAAGDLAGVDVPGAQVVVDPRQTGGIEPRSGRVDGEVQGGVHGGTLAVTCVTRRTS